MGDGHIDGDLSDAIAHLFRVANGQGSAEAIDAAMNSLAECCSASEFAVERLRSAALEAQIDADRRRRRESALRDLIRVAHRLLESPSLAEAMDAIVSATRLLLSADVAHINLHAEGGDNNSIRAIEGEMTEAFRRQQTPPGAGLTGLVTETKSPYVSTDYLSDPRIRHSASGDASVRSDGLRTLVGVPIMHRDEVIAVLIVSYRATTSISDEQLGLLVSLATLAGLTFEDKRRRDRQDEISRSLQDGNALLRTKVAQLTWSAATYERLIELVLLRCGIDEFMATVSDAFGGEAGLLDATGKALAPLIPPGAPAPDFFKELTDRLKGAAMEPVVFQLAHDEDPLWVCSVASHDELLGAIFTRRRAMDQIEQQTFARAARLAGDVLREFEYGALPGELDEGMVASLLDGRRQGDHTLDLSRSMGSATAADLIVLVAIGDASLQVRMHHCGVQIARDHQGVAGSQGGCVVLILPGTDARSMVARMQLRLATSLGSPVWAGAALSADPRDLSLAAAEALRCARALQRMTRSGGAATVETLGQIGLLLGSDSEETVVDFIRMSIGPLLEYDGERRSELISTLEAYLSHNSSLKASASELHVHPNTVLQRLQKISTLLNDDDWRSRSEKRLELQLALRLHGLSQSSG
jgi:hypothetical protein